MDKDKLKINIAFLSYSSEDTDVIEIDYDQPLLHIFFKNKQMRTRMIMLICISIFVFA